MKSLLNLTLAAVALALIAPPLIAEACPGDKNLKEISLTGTVVREYKEYEGKDGTIKTVAVYFLQTDDEKIRIPDAGCRKDNDASLELSQYVDVDVTLKAKGAVKKSKDGDVRTHLAHLVSVERVEQTTT